MKKCISVFLSILMCLNILCVSVSAEEDYKLTDEQITLLTAIGMYEQDVQLSEELTRGEFAEMLVESVFDEPEYLIGEDTQAFNDVPADHEYYASVMLLKNLKVTLGDGEGNFNPEEKILANDAIVMAVRFLGYSKIAEKTGYIPFAAQKGISKGLKYSYEDNLSMYNALILIFNVLSVDVTDQYETDATASFVKAYRALYKVSGVVEDDGFINKYGLSQIAKDEIVIDGKIYKNATTEKNLFGYNVVAYYKTTKEDKATIVALTVTDKNNTLIIEAKNIEKYDSTTHSYHYRENEYTDEVEIIDIPLRISIIYNGVPVTINDTQFTNDSFVPFTGSVTFFDADNDRIYDYLYINSYETFVVNTVDATKEIIYLKDFERAIELKKGKYELLDKDNEAVALTELVEGNVLSVMKSFSGDVMKIYVTNKTVVDVVSAKDEDGVITTQNNGEFELSNNYIEKLYNKSDKKYSKIVEALESIEFSVLYRIYTDIYGDVALIEREATNVWSVGVLVAAGNNARTALSENYIVDIYGSNGQVARYKLAEKVYVSDEQNISELYKDEKAVDILSTYAGNKTNAEKIIRYKLNVQGVVTDVELPLEEGYPVENIDGDRLYVIYNALSSTVSYNSGQGFTGVMVPSDSCGVFVINKNDTKNTEDYAICSVSDLFVHDYSYNLIGYGTDTKNLITEYIIYPAEEVLNYSFKQTNGYFIVSEIIEEFDYEEMKKVYRIEGYRGVTPTTFYVEDESLIKNIPVFETGKTINLDEGDIFAFSVNARETGRVVLNGIIVLYDADGVLPSTGKGFYGKNNGTIAGSKVDSVLSADAKEYGNPVAISEKSKGQTYSINSGAHTDPKGIPCRIASGFVYSIKEGNVTLTTQPINSVKYSTAENRTGKYVTEAYSNITKKIIKIKKTANNVEVSVGTKEDLKPYTVYGHDCSQVVFLGYYGLDFIYVFE